MAASAGENFITWHSRPKAASGFGTWSDPGIDHGELAIVMQGPVTTSDAFSLESMRLYAAHMPGARRILSTWDDTEPSTVDQFRSEGCDVVLSSKPKVPGLFNVNMQIVSAAAGMRRAQEAGAKWAFKTRVDQRLCAANVFAYSRALCEAFPVVPGFAQKHRIVGVGRGSLKYCPYHLTDQAVFGHMDDMVTYWNAPLRTDAPPSHWPEGIGTIFHQAPIGELCRHGAAESYLASSFLSRVGRELKWTLEDSWAAFRDHFSIADTGLVDLYWYKVQYDTNAEFDREYACIDNRREIDFKEWLLLVTGAIEPESARQFESALQTTFTNPIQRPEPT